MEKPNVYEMEDMEDSYVNIQNPYSAAQDPYSDECKHDNLNSNRGIPHNNDASTSRTTKTELTDVKTDKKCNLINPAVMLAFISLLVGIVAISLVIVFNNKFSGSNQLFAGDRASLSLQEAFLGFEQQLEKITTTMSLLKLEQNKSSMNLEALYAVKNRKTDLEKYKKDNQRRFKQLTTKEEANELNKTLMALQNKITDIENKNSAKDKKLNEQQNLIKLLLQSSPMIPATKWLTLSNGYEYRRTKNKTKLWRDARDECQSYGRGRLASVGMRDATVRTFLVLHFLPKSNEYWIGLRANTTFNWYWIDNTERGEDENAIWFDGEPTSTNNERCAVLSMRTSAIGANSVRCNDMTTTYYGICERKV